MLEPKDEVKKLLRERITQPIMEDTSDNLYASVRDFARKASSDIRKLEDWEKTGWNNITKAGSKYDKAADLFRDLDMIAHLYQNQFGKYFKRK